jgi:hypothetical protein
LTVVTLADLVGVPGVEFLPRDPAGLGLGAGRERGQCVEVEVPAGCEVQVCTGVRDPAVGENEASAVRLRGQFEAYDAVGGLRRTAVPLELGQPGRLPRPASCP